jgi:hypothetical protein
VTNGHRDTKALVRAGAGELKADLVITNGRLVPAGCAWTAGSPRSTRAIAAAVTRRTRSSSEQWTTIRVPSSG